MRKRVLVTGGAGFISSNFIRHLLANTGYEVVSLDALTYAGNLENLADVMSHERLSFVHGDIRDAELVAKVVAEVDVIVNAAAESHVEKSIAEGASEFVTTNVEGTQILLDAIRRTPVERFILISSSEVYGTAEYAPMDEEHPLNPRSPYAGTKAGGDRLAYSYFVTYGLPIVIVRPFNNYGPRQHPEKVIPRFITQALTGEPLTIHGDGHASRDWLYVDDDAEAIEAIIEADIDALAGEVVNVATGVDISVRDVAEAVQAAVGLPVEKAYVEERPGQVDRHIGSTDKLARADRLARADDLRAGARADGRVVPRERGVVAVAQPARQRLLVLGAGPAQVGLLRAARRRGLFVVAVDRDPAAQGFEYADKRAVISTEDEPGIDRLARAEDVDGIISPGADWPVGIAARVAERIGLPHPIDPATAVLATSKLAAARAVRGRRRRAAALAARLGAGRRARIRASVRRQGPDRQGQRGLSLVRSRRSCRLRSRPRSRPRAAASCLVEELVDGPEVTVNAVSVDGVFHPLTVTDRLTADPPAFGVALAHAWPSRAEEDCVAATQSPVEAARAAAAALGIRNGPTYTQLRLGPLGPAGRRACSPARGRPRRRALRAGNRVRPERRRARRGARGEIVLLQHKVTRPRAGPASSSSSRPRGRSRASRVSRRRRRSRACARCGSTAGRASRSGRFGAAPTAREPSSPSATTVTTLSPVPAVRPTQYASSSNDGA